MNLKDLFSRRKKDSIDFAEDEIKEMEKVLIKIKKYCDNNPDCKDCIFSDDPNEACFLAVPSYWRIEEDSSDEATENKEDEKS